MMIVGLHSVADFFFKWKLAALWNSSLSCDDFKDPKSNVLQCPEGAYQCHTGTLSCVV